jgi:hypothetical protein
MMPPMPIVSAMVCRSPYFLDLEHGNGVVSAVQRRAAVQRGFDGRVGLQRFRDPARHNFGSAEPLRINIVQADGGTGKFWKAQDVAEQIFRKYGASGA